MCFQVFRSGVGVTFKDFEARYGRAVFKSNPISAVYQLGTNENGVTSAHQMNVPISYVVLIDSEWCPV